MSIKNKCINVPIDMIINKIENVHKSMKQLHLLHICG